MGFEIVEQLGWRYPAAPRVAGRRRHAAAAHRARACASCARSASSTASCRASTRRRRPAARRSCNALEAGARASGAGPAEHDREVDRDRQPGRRLPGASRRVQRDRRRRRGGVRRADRRRDPAARRDRRASSPSRPAARRSPATIDLIQRGVIPPRRVGRRLRHRQRLQDRRSRGGPHHGAGAPEPRVQGIRSLVGVAPGARVATRTRSSDCRRGVAVELDTIGSLNSIVRAARAAPCTVAVDPIFASATSRKNCDGSSTVWPLKPTMTSPGPEAGLVGLRVARHPRDERAARARSRRLPRRAAASASRRRM